MCTQRGPRPLALRFKISGIGMHDDTTAGSLKQKTKTDGGGVRARGRVSGACKARPGPEVGNGGISRRSDRAKAVRNGGGWGTQTVPEKRDFGKRSVEVHLVSKKPRPLSHRQAYERQISSWVGDDQRTPAVVCFFFSFCHPKRGILALGLAGQRVNMNRVVP